MAVLVVGVVVGGRHWLDQQAIPPTPGTTDHFIAGIHCSDVIGHLPAYLNGTLDREGHETFELVFAHLQQCRKCDTQYKMLRDAQPIQAFDETTPQGIASITHWNWDRKTDPFPTVTASLR